jgi:hypothetical protein
LIYGGRIVRYYRRSENEFIGRTGISIFNSRKSSSESSLSAIEISSRRREGSGRIISKGKIVKLVQKEIVESTHEEKIQKFLIISLPYVAKCNSSE